MLPMCHLFTTLNSCSLLQTLTPLSAAKLLNIIHIILLHIYYICNRYPALNLRQADPHISPHILTHTRNILYVCACV